MRHDLLRKSVGLIAVVAAVLGTLGACSSDDSGGGGERYGQVRQRVIQPHVNAGVTTIAGDPNGLPGNSGDGLPASASKLNDPAGVAVAEDGTIYIADSGNNSVRRIVPATPFSANYITSFVQGRPNKILNPRAEKLMQTAPGILDWTIVSGQWFSAFGGCAGTQCDWPYDGSRFFTGGPVASAELKQQIIFTSAELAEIQTGQVSAHFHIQMRARAGDFARAQVVYLDSLTNDNAIVASLDTFERSVIRWEPWTRETPLPTGVKRAIVRLFTRSTDQGPADAYFDGLQLRLVNNSSPSSGAGADDRLTSVTAVAVAGDLVLVGAADFVAYDKTTGNPVYTNGLPARISSIAKTSGGITYIVDPTNPLLYVFGQGNVPYFADVAALPNAEPLAVTATTLDATKDRLYLTFRGSFSVSMFDCPRSTVARSVVTCTHQPNGSLGSTKGNVDDVDGTAGGEKFGYPHALALGKFGDLLIGDEGNHSVRRALKPLTLTSAGTGTSGFQDGASNQAKFFSPSGVAAHPDGSIIVADRMNNRLRKIVCGGSNICSATSGMACPVFTTDDQPCTDDTCMVLGINHTLKAAGAGCDDATVCNGRETCTAAGACVSGPAPGSPDDGNPCTLDYCDPALGNSHTTLNGNYCSSGSACTQGGICSSGTCIAGPPVPVDDGLSCTADVCNDVSGVVHSSLNQGASCPGGTCDGSGACLPPNVNELNPEPIDPTVATPPDRLIDDFLSGNGGGQVDCAGEDTDCTNDDFVPEHMALVRGVVKNSAGTVLSGVKISVVNHPEFGSTETLASGEFFLVVEGGAPLTIRAENTGMLPADRPTNPPWGGTDFVDEIRLITLDPAVTTVTFANPGGTWAWGTNIPASTAEPNSARRAAVFFPNNVVVSAGGSSLASAKFRVTEFTVGASGRARMPAPIAENTMYTYASEFSLEDAAGNLYDDVTFDPPVISYLSNGTSTAFLGMNTGEAMPIGYYNRDAARWEPMQKDAATLYPGRVIELGASSILGQQAGDLAISAEEETMLRSKYSVGTKIWRMPLTHFSPLDFNLGLGVPSCEPPPGSSTPVCPAGVASVATGGGDAPLGGSCTKPGCTIDVERQILRESLPVAGTPFSLNYSSENTPGYAWNKTVNVNFENHAKHPKLVEYAVDFKVAGKRVAYGPVQPTGAPPNVVWPKSFRATWDGKDQAGRAVQGSVMATLDVGAVYKAERRRASVFGSTGSSSSGFVVEPLPLGLTGTRANPWVTVWSRQYQRLQVWDATALGFGGWTLDVHHAYEPSGGVVYFGDGTHRKVEDLGGGLIASIAGGAAAGSTPNGTPVANATFEEIEGLAVGRDGAIYLAIPGDDVVRKISVENGQYTTISDYVGISGSSSAAGDAADPSVASGGVDPTASGYLSEPNSIALHDDGRLVISDRLRHRVYERGLDGKLRTIAGTGAGTGSPQPNCGVFTNQAAATTVPLCNPNGVATAPDGSVYLLDHRLGSGATGYVARIDQSGRLWYVAGLHQGDAGSNYYRNLPAGTLATQIGILNAQIAVDRNNKLWLSTDLDLISIESNGQIRVFAMNHSGSNSGSGMDLSLFPNRDFLRPSRTNQSGYLLERCTPTKPFVSGMPFEPQCARIAGTNTFSGQDTAIGQPAVGNPLNRIDAVATNPDGSVVFAEPNPAFTGWRVLRVTPPFAPRGQVEECIYKIPARDGSEYYCFDANGRHKSTVNALTNASIRTFVYDVGNTELLLRIVETDGRQTIIDRSTPGVVTITSPTSQQTQIALDGDNHADTFTGTRSIDVQHAENGLLTRLTEEGGLAHSFAYDNFGRLARDEDPDGGYQIFDRTDEPSGKYTVSSLTRLGKRDSFSRLLRPDAIEERTVTLRNGLVHTSTTDTGGTVTTNLADKTSLTTTPGPDPRFGLWSPFVAASTVSVPGNSMSTKTTFTAVGTTLTRQTTLTGATTRVFTSVYSDTGKTIKVTLPGGVAAGDREYTYTLDTLGRVASFQAPSVPLVNFDYDLGATTTLKGRLDRIRQGTGRVVDLTYSTSGTNKGFLTGASDAHASGVSAITTVFAPDQKGLPLSQTRTDSQLGSLVTQFGWNARGQLSAVRPPSLVASGAATHDLHYDLRGYLDRYQSPQPVETTNFKTDLDGFFQSIDTLGTDDDLVFTNDPVSGRLNAIRVGSQTNITVAYYPVCPSSPPGCAAGQAPGRPQTVTDSKSGIQTTFGWAGSLPKSVAQAGSTVSWSYNNDFNVNSEALSVASPSHSSTASFTYDPAGPITCASLGTCSAATDRLTLTRDATNLRLSSMTLGTGLTETFGYNSYGELRHQDSPPFRVDYEDLVPTTDILRDAMGRVKRRKERVGAGAATKTFDHVYNDQGGLWQVNGAVTNEYRYDKNGNRTYAKNSAGTLGATAGDIVYDAADRLTKYGSTTFEYTGKGDLRKRTEGANTTLYDYDAIGGLRTVRLPDRVIDYVIDGLGRRTGKKVNGVLQKQWVYGAGLGPIAELDGAGNVKMRFVYASKPNIPDFMKVYVGGTSSTLYRVFSDQLGTPRLIYDVAANTNFELTEYDEFGIKLSDSNAVFEFPFGFGGGLYDPDTKLTRFGARDYDASIGRWLSRDAMLFGGQQTNLHVYVGNDPINLRDPTGRHPVLVAGLWGAAANSLIWAFTAPTDLTWCQALRGWAGAVAGGFVGGAAAVIHPLAAFGGGSLGHAIDHSIAGNEWTRLGAALAGVGNLLGAGIGNEVEMAITKSTTGWLSESFLASAGVKALAAQGHQQAWASGVGAGAGSQIGMGLTADWLE
jgi:RHS repeat-associated protein